jgi:hypothetical protein
MEYVAGIRRDIIGGAADDVLAAWLAINDGRNESEYTPNMRDEDWLALAGRAQRHDVLPILAEQIARAAQRPQLPARVERALETSQIRTLKSNRAIYRDLAEITQRFQACGMPAVALKGVYLATITYADIALRSMSDIDVLVHEENLQAAEDALIRAGYAREHSDHAESVNGHHLPPFTKPGGSIVEVHWTLNEYGLPWEEQPGKAVFEVNMAAVWNRVRPVTLEGSPLLALDPIDMILHLGVHTAYNHAFNNGLRDFCDIDRFIRRRSDEIDWDKLLATAAEWGAAKLLCVVLRLSHDMLHTPIPLAARAISDWTPGDDAVYPVVRAEVLRCARRGSNERKLRRAIIDPWIVEVSGAPSRGDLAFSKSDFLPHALPLALAESRARRLGDAQT